MFAFAANNDNLGRRRNSVGYSTELVNVKLLVRSMPVLGINADYLAGT